MHGNYTGQWRKLLVLGSLLLTGSVAQAQLSGAIFTTLPDGTTVNANLYDAKEDVYLNGGPQNVHSAGLPDGVYFFQVTNPNGAVLLSTTNAMDRLEKVTNGRFAGRCDDTGTLLADPVSPHPNGPLNIANGGIPVQLFPFNDTPNNGGEYKAWLILRRFDGDSKVYGTPAGDGVHIDFLHRYAKTDNFKIRTTVFPPIGSLGGAKWFDLNMNGQNDGEPPIQGFIIKIVLNGDDANPIYIPTDPTGNWHLGDIPGGTTYKVCEILPPDAPYDNTASTKWIQTAPGTSNDPTDERCYEGVVDGDTTGIDFGNTQVFSISGDKFYDRNLNGTQEVGEGGISGWKIDYSITYPDTTVDTGTLTTDGSGNWSIGNIPIGSTYSFSEQTKTGWKQTAPAGNLYAAGPIAVSSPGPYDATFNQNDIKDLKFGNILQASLKGTKFRDANMDGTKQGNEGGISGVTINISGTKPDGTTFTDSTTSDANGNYSFGPYPDGTTYDITETVPAGYIQTTPVHLTGTITASGPIDSSSTLDDITGLNIGNIAVFKICGFKFYDTNANGAFDSGEPYIKGFKIQVVWTKPNGTTGTDTFYTDVNGKFQAGPYPAGTTYLVKEVLPPNPTGKLWHQSYPAAPGTYSGTLTVTVNNLGFGNFLTGPGGGLTLGFWSNKNGYASANAIGWTTVFAKLNGSNLRNGNGTLATWPVTAAGYKTFQSWLLAANATNMANMLSAQLAAMELNVMSGGVSGSSLIYAPGTTSADALGYATVNAIIAEAIAELGLHGNTTASGATRNYQEKLKIALDNANNNLAGSFVQPPVTVIVPSPY
jgi:hypothetical protein